MYIYIVNIQAPAHRQRVRRYIQVTTVKGGLGPANFRSLSALRAPSKALSRTFV